MKRTLGGAAVLLVSLTSAAEAEVASGERELPASVIFGRVAPSTVVVECTLKGGRSQGSGVVVGKDEVVTNHHVIDGALTITVRQGDSSWSASVVAFDPKRDVAILRVVGETGAVVCSIAAPCSGRSDEIRPSDKVSSKPRGAPIA